MTLCAIPVPNGLAYNEPDPGTNMYPYFAPPYYVKMLIAEAGSLRGLAAHSLCKDLRSSEDPDLQLTVRHNVPPFHILSEDAIP